MDNVQVIENLKQLLVEHTSNTEIQIANNLTMIFQSFQNKSLKEDIDSYAEFVLLGASLFELKAKRLLPQDEEVDWLDEVELIKDKDLIIVVGSSNSSNSTRLAELAKQDGVESVLVGNIESFDLSILLNKKKIGITAGASAPEVLVKNLIKKIKSNYDVLIEEMSGIEENIIFKLPNI